MEIKDNRKFDEYGNSTTVEEYQETVIDKSLAQALADIPRQYSAPRPRADYTLIRQKAAETMYRGTRFVIPDSAQQSPNEGVVVSVGINVDPAGDCKPGDLVTFGRYNADPIEVDGDEYQLVHKADVKLVQEVTYAVGQH
jgi:co-chaperonin GroES (HSP10)